MNIILAMTIAWVCSIPLETGEVVKMPCVQGDERTEPTETSPVADEWIVLPEGQEVDPREIR